MWTVALSGQPYQVVPSWRIVDWRRCCRLRRLEIRQAGTIYIAGDVTGTRTSTIGSSPISAGSILLGPTKSLIIGGSIETAPGIGGVNDRGSFAILAEGGIGRLEIHGNVLGSETNRAGIYFADYVAPFLKRKTSAAIGAIEIRGRVEWAELASVPTADFATAGNDGITRRVGSLVVYGDWISSTLAVGVDPGADGVFGDGGESVSSTPFPAASSKDGVDKIVIGGRVIGTVSAGDVFAFVAPRIGSMTIGGRAVPLTAGPDYLLLSPGTGSPASSFVRIASTTTNSPVPAFGCPIAENWTAAASGVAKRRR